MDAKTRGEEKGGPVPRRRQPANRTQASGKSGGRREEGGELPRKGGRGRRRRATAGGGAGRWLAGGVIRGSDEGAGRGI